MRATLIVLGALSIGCGGRVEQRVEEISFAPESGSAGYGAFGPMSVQLEEPAGRTMRLSLAKLEGTSAVENGQARVTLDGWLTLSLSATRGTVTVEPGALPAHPGSFGAIRVHVDVFLSDGTDDRRVFHVAGDYDADVTVVG